MKYKPHTVFGLYSLYENRSHSHPDLLAADLEQIASANRISKGRVLELALERLVAEVRETGRLPLPPVELNPAPAGV